MTFLVAEQAKAALITWKCPACPRTFVEIKDLIPHVIRHALTPPSDVKVFNQLLEYFKNIAKMGAKTIDDFVRDVMNKIAEAYD